MSHVSQAIREETVRELLSVDEESGEDFAEEFARGALAGCVAYLEKTHGPIKTGHMLILLANQIHNQTMQ